MRGVVEAGPCVRSLQIDYDDEVEYHGVQKLHDLARTPEDQPFFLTISFTHPHPPFVAPQEHCVASTGPAGQTTKPFEPVDALDGQSLVPLLQGAGDGASRCVISEYSLEGVSAASRMLREGPYKYIYTRGLKPMLFDLVADPDELHDLAGRPVLADVEAGMHARLIAGWDPEAVHARIVASQKRRLFLAEVAGSSSHYGNWAYQPFVDESKRYIRGAGGAGPTAAKSKARFPFVKPADPD